MSFWQNLKTRGTALRQQMGDEVSKFRNEKMLQAVINACAVIAAADGNVTGDEKQKMMGFIRNSDELKVFDTDKCIEAFEKAVSRFDFDHSIGEAEALKIIGRMKGSGAESLIVRVACAIGAADGDFDADEQKAAAKIARELGLDPADFELPA
jgi:tellurite resistance protein TerB